MVHAEASARGRRARSADAVAREREQQRVYRQERRSTPEGLARDRQIMRDAKRRAREVRAQQRAEDGVEQQMLLAHNASGSRIVANARRIPGVRWHCGEGSSAHERARRDVKEDIETFVHVPLDDKQRPQSKRRRRRPGRRRESAPTRRASSRRARPSGQPPLPNPLPLVRRARPPPHSLSQRRQRRRATAQRATSRAIPAERAPRNGLARLPRPRRRPD